MNNWVHQTKCLVCKCANYSPTAFDLYNVGKTALFLNSSLPSPKGTPFKPLHISTPTRQAQHKMLRTLNVNTPFCVKNLPGMLNLIVINRPDMIIATEMRLDGNIVDSEILPSNYKAWRCNRNREGELRQGLKEMEEVWQP